MFLNLLKSDLKRAVFNWGTPIVVLVMLFMSTNPIFAAYSQGFFGKSWFMSGGKLTSLRIFFTALCVIPYAVSYCDEFNTGFRNAMLMRAGYRRYAWSKMIAVTVSGIVPFLIWQLLFYAFCMLATHPGPDPEMFYEVTGVFFREAAMDLPVLMPMLERGAGLSYLAISAFCAALNGAAWATVGLAVSAYFPNRYVTLAGPFVLFSAWDMVCTFMAARIGHRSPIYLFNVMDWEPVGFVYPISVLVFLLLLSWYLFYQRAKEALKNA